jgi:hypothetical protein
MMLTLEQFRRVEWLNDNGAEDLASVMYSHMQNPVQVDKLVSLRGGSHKSGFVFIVVLQQSRLVGAEFHSDWSFATYYDNLPEASAAFNTLCETALKEKEGYEAFKS